MPELRLISASALPIFVVSFLFRRLVPPLTVLLLPLLPASPPMAAAACGSWICGECGKVCRSRGGLTKHSSVHKKGSRIGGVRDNLHRIYHAALNGRYPTSRLIRLAGLDSASSREAL